MQANKRWYRIHYPANREPELETSLEVGSNDSGKVKNFFLAPIANGEVCIDCTRVAQASQNGYPNGYFPSVEEAKANMFEVLQQQIDVITEAKQKLEESNL